MKRSVVVRWSLVSLAVLLAAGGLWLAGWRANFDRSVALSNHFGNVQNGSAYDRAAVDIGAATKIVLPHDAVLLRTGEPGKVQLFMRKTLAFVSHPPEPINIQDARKNMGCAVRADGDALVIATFGEWDSHIEGGSRMRLVAKVPPGVRVEQRKGLSGPDGAGQEWHGAYLTKPKDAKGGYWYGPASPTVGWRAVPDVPDLHRIAD